jgi:hypothetical protein
MSGRKTSDNNQWGLVSTDGTRATAGAAAVVDGDGVEPITDENGALWARAAGSAVTPSNPLQRYDNGGNFAGAQEHQVSAAPVTVLRLFGFKSTAGTEYIQVYDVNGAAAGTPLYQVAVPQDGSFSIDLGIAGRPFANGLTVALSTTPGSLTAGSAGLWLNAEYVN